MDSCLQKLTDALQSAVEGMSREQLRWHPDGKWCSAEVLEHLYLTYTGTIKGFERVLAANMPLATTATFKQRRQTFVVLTLNYLPSGRKAPATTHPKGLALEDVRNQFGTKIEAMDSIIEQCQARFGRGTKLLDHPILGPLTAAQWRKFHLLHGMHHQKQILRLREGIKRAAS